MNEDIIGKFVNINLKHKNKLFGKCFTIDPVSKSAVILTEDASKDGTFSPVVILSHSVENWTVGQATSLFETDVFRHFEERFERLISGSGSGEVMFTEEQLSERQLKMQKWLELNRLPVSLNGENILSVVNGLALIEPPYTVESCRSTNTIVLDRVMRIVKSCPNLND